MDWLQSELFVTVRLLTPRPPDKIFHKSIEEVNNSFQQITFLIKLYITKAADFRSFWMILVSRLALSIYCNPRVLQAKSFYLNNLENEVKINFLYL